jgi:serine/threonine protein phosphatase PrpC
MMITANPDITKIKNENVDFIIMGCDGIWEVKSNGEMVDWIKKRLESNIELKNITEELLNELISKDSGNQYGMDNMSAILIKFNKKK